MDPIEALISRTEARRQKVSAQLSPKSRSALGQYFTPDDAARLIASMVTMPEDSDLRLLDPGAGVGSLTAALVAHLISGEYKGRVEIVAVEVDPQLLPYLQETLNDVAKTGIQAGLQIEATIIGMDFIVAATGSNPQRSLNKPFDIIIANPPYKKLGASSIERKSLLSLGVDCSNIYSAFISLCVNLLQDGGQLAAITPRSFTNGSYFHSFREFLTSRASITRLHVFESRSAVFADSAVLQENVIFHAVAGREIEQVVLSISDDHIGQSTTREVRYDEVISPADHHRFIRIPIGNHDTSTAELIANMPCSLADLGLRVSTGKIVDFRAKDHLLAQPNLFSIPLIYPGNLRSGKVEWPLPLRKPQALIDHPKIRNLLLPTEHFVLVNRFSAKEQRRRVVAAVFDPEDIPSQHVGFENHLNVFHKNERGLPENLAYGLCLWLNSSLVDTYIRIFSGHTQVNATDLRTLRYPNADSLTSLGAAFGRGTWPSQEKIDALVDAHILGQEGGASPTPLGSPVDHMEDTITLQE
ncbi:Eco57I restriction-modification methylase domain-containing protein [Nonomuraea sp. NPDC051191]|uniref:Eco57I restriction-modification methylase domain-containing protein n=1 Tax=Nonomuraea sp. NPDC051191 TaxID=3364372 RepID=UPI0037B8FCFB